MAERLPHALLAPLIELHAEIRRAVLERCRRASLEELSEVAGEEAGDTIYAIDRVSEEVLVEFFEREVAPRESVVLIAEGLDGAQIVLPRGTREDAARWRVIVDPIDGTRGLMYQKRSGWVLTGVAANRGPETTLADIELAVQTEVPLVKQYLADVLWAERGRGALAERVNVLTGERQALGLRPSSASTIAHGFSTISRFFPGAREELAALDDEIVLGALGPPEPGRARAFEDQYISSAGQLYELMAGHDRFVADLRPLVNRYLAARGRAAMICCHPYDLCTELIARELGVIVTDELGRPLASPLAVEPDVTWVGYANARLRSEIEPLLRSALERRAWR